MHLPNPPLVSTWKIYSRQLHGLVYWMLGNAEHCLVLWQRLAGIFITHMHGDHVYGLPSMLLHLNVANTQNRRSRRGLGATGITRERDSKQNVSSHQIQQGYSEGSPLHLYGPEGLYNYVTSALRLSHAKIRMKVNFSFFISFSVIGVIFIRSQSFLWTCRSSFTSWSCHNLTSPLECEFCFVPRKETNYLCEQCSAINFGDQIKIMI